jgi:hypothetical protein
MFMVLNYLIESGCIQKMVNCIRNRNLSNYELKKTSPADGMRHDIKYESYPLTYALKVENLSKTYDGREFAVSDVSFNVERGEVSLSYL